MCCWSNSRLGDLWGQLENLQCRSLGIWGVVVKGEPLPVQNPPDSIAMRININVTISIFSRMSAIAAFGVQETVEALNAWRADLKPECLQ